KTRQESRFAGALVFPLIVGLVFATFSFSSCPIFAQTAASGALSGTVVDQTKAVVTGAKVRVTNEATGQVRETATKGDGSFAVQLLPPGSYAVEVAAPGFKKALRANVSVNV